MTGRERRTRLQRAMRCYKDARFEIDYVRKLDAELRNSRGYGLREYLKLQAIAQAKFLVRLGRKLQFTSERVQLPRDLGVWS
jgi:hypothetical protein